MAVFRRNDDTQYQMDELKEYCTKRNKLDTKIYMSHNFIYVKHLEKDKFIDTEV